MSYELFKAVLLIVNVFCSVISFRDENYWIFTLNTIAWMLMLATLLVSTE